jgi:hypothetical protein
VCVCVCVCVCVYVCVYVFNEMLSWHEAQSFLTISYFQICFILFQHIFEFQIVYLYFDNTKAMEKSSERWELGSQ